MKLIVLTLCVFIALSSLADAARFYRCVDRDGNTIMTDNPPPDATCESKGAEKDLTPQERERERQKIEAEQASRKIDRQTQAANARIDAAIDSIKNNKANYYKGGGLRPEATDRIIELEKARLRDTRSEARIDDLIIAIKNNPSNSYKGGGLRPEATQQIVDLEKARLRLQEDPQDAGLMMRNQQDDMEDKMKRQQKDMEKKKRQQEAEIHRQEREIRDLKSQKEWADHKARWNIK